MSRFESDLARFVKDHHLPAAYIEQARTHYLPLVDWLLQRMERKEGTLVAGIYGAQGSGKSTLADLLCRAIGSVAEKTVVNLSIDDFYLTKDERAQLASDISLLLRTRGPPGTHDVRLALSTIREATGLADGESMTIPRFDKATDDRVALPDYDTAAGPVDIVILEGWCLGCRPVDPVELVEPINDLERDEDTNGTWRRYVNASIEHYQPLFKMIDTMIMLKTSEPGSALRWRSEQEDKLRAGERSSGSGVMTAAEVERFVQFFERVSRNAERHVEQVADVIIAQDRHRKIKAVEYR